MTSNEPRSEQQPIIQVIKGNKIYGGVHAIKDIDFDVLPGEVHALVGENGAGKSTLVKGIAGTIEFTSGELRVDGKLVHFKTSRDALNAGISMVYQETSLVPTMSVAQNLELGNERLFTRMRSLNIRAQTALQSLNYNIDPRTPTSSLGTAKRQMVEIARAVYFKSRVIIFDEPTASLTPEEILRFFELVTELKFKSVSVIFISHALEESLQIADRITVLRDGEKVITCLSKDLTRESLIRYMVGRDISETHYNKRRFSHRPGAVERKKVLSVENLTMGTVVKNMSFTAYAGEVLCLYGLVGSGRTEVARIIYGAQKRNLLYGGRVYLFDRPIRYRQPSQAIEDGIVYITEDRKTEGIFETMKIDNNIYIGYLTSPKGRRLILSKHERGNIVKKWVDRLSIRALSQDAKVNELSGGNQQKVVVAKSLVQEPGVIIFDEPTRGIDVASVPEIHKAIRELANEGKAVIVITSYLPEALSISDRILVTQIGHITAEFSPEEATEEKIMYAAIH